MFGSGGKSTLRNYQNQVYPGQASAAAESTQAFRDYLASGGAIPEAMQANIQGYSDVAMEQMMADINRQAGTSREQTAEMLRKKGLLGQGVSSSGEVGGALSLLEARRLQRIADASRQSRMGAFGQMMQTQRWLPGMMQQGAQMALPGAQLGLQEWGMSEQMELERKRLESQEAIAEQQMWANIASAGVEGVMSLP